MGTWYWDVATDQLDWDDQLELVFRLPPSRFPRSYAEYAALIHPDDREAARAKVRAALDAGESEYRVEHRILRGDGTIGWSSGIARILRGSDGEPEAMIGVSADITDRKRREAEQRAARDAELLARDTAATSVRRLRTLAEASELLGASLDVDTTLQQVADLAVRSIADWCVVDLLGDGRDLRRVAVAHVDPAMTAHARLLQERFPTGVSDRTFIGPVLRSGRPTLWNGVPSDFDDMIDDPEVRSIMQTLQLTSTAMVPMTARGRVIGALSLVRTHGRHFDEDDLALTAELGRRAAVAVDNARVYADRDHVATVLQNSLLPPALPSIPGVDIATRYRAGSSEVGIGGDFYDVFAVGEGRWRLLVGDVCGKGAEAAALTGAVRYTLRAAAIDEPDPVEVLRMTGDTLIAQDLLGTDDRQGRFCTVALAAFAPTPNRASASGAPLAVDIALSGHPTPLLRRNDGSIERCHENGMLLGILPGVEAARWHVDLEPGDCLVFYTDGVTEARNGDTLFGDERLAAALAAAPATSADDVARALETAVDQFARLADDTGSEQQRDDTAIVVLLAC